MKHNSHLDFRFFGLSQSGKTLVWNVFNITSWELIGRIKWAGSFRKYAFFPETNTMYDSNCLQDIAEFLNKSMETRENDKG